jgi:hypothetical protein
MKNLIITHHMVKSAFYSPVVTICTTCFNIVELHSAPRMYLCVSHGSIVKGKHRDFNLDINSSKQFILLPIGNYEEYCLVGKDAV